MALLVGIDPGVHTGLAMWDTERRHFVELTTVTFVEAMMKVLDWAEAGWDIRIVIEDARRRKWIPQERSLSQFKGRAMGAGSVKRDCQIWEDFALFNDFPIDLVPPRKGLTKRTAESFAAVTGWKGRTSNHARDAAMLVWGK